MQSNTNINLGHFPKERFFLPNIFVSGLINPSLANTIFGRGKMKGKKVIDGKLERKSKIVIW